MTLFPGADEDDEEEPPWARRPYRLPVRGHEREFFTIGHLAAALSRSAMTIRGWEAQSPPLFPKPTFTVNGKDPRRRRRLYTRSQIEGVIKIATEEGILQDRRRYIAQTRFPERCHALFAANHELPEPYVPKTKKKASHDR